MERSCTEKNNLLVFNIRTDADHPTQAITTRWLNEFSRNFKRIFVITIHKGRINLARNVEVYALNKRNSGRLQMICQFYYLLFFLLFKKKVDAVFVHQAVLLGVMAGPILLLKGIPVVTWRSHKSDSISLRMCHFFSRAVTTSSRDAFPFASRKLIVTGHGIDTESFKPMNKKNRDKHRYPVIGYVGRYSPVKKIEILLEAVSIMVGKGFDHIRVHLRGLTQNKTEERYLKKLKQLIEALNLSNIVTCHGAVSNWEMPDIFNGFDLFVSQQETGGTDKALLEAMSMGLPVVMATTTFNRFLGEDLINKIVFSSGSAGEMAKKIMNLMEIRDGERNSIGLKLRHIVVENHSLQKMASQVALILRS